MTIDDDYEVPHFIGSCVDCGEDVWDDCGISIGDGRVVCDSCGYQREVAAGRTEP